MKGLSILIVLVALVQWSTSYSYGSRPGSYGSGSYSLGSTHGSYGLGTPGSYGSGSQGSYGSGSYGSNSYGSGSYGSGTHGSGSYGSGSYGSNTHGATNGAYAATGSVSSSAAYSGCCSLSAWAQENLNAIREFAGRLRQEYNSMYTGNSRGYSPSYTPWSESIISLTGKTSGELDAICRLEGEQLLRDIRAGVINYQTIAQSNFFEWKSADVLHRYYVDDAGQQQSLDFGGYQHEDLSTFDNVKNYNFPTEVKVIDGKTYVVHKNVTEAHKTMGTGEFGNPLVTVVKRNRTIIATNNGPTYPTGSFNAGYNTGPYGSNTGYVPAGSTTTVTRKKTVYDWANQNMEPTVVGYSPSVNIGSNPWVPAGNLYKPPVHIPVESDVETFPPYTPNLRPGSTVTINRYNKTTITNATGTHVTGSQSHKKWVDGKLVYDTERPFGEWSVPRDEEWKREERERFFWFLSSGNISPQSLVVWQRQQEDRLLALTTRHNVTLDEIHEWHRKELERYRVLLGQYSVQTNDATSWKRMERGRLDWLIHQNSVTREDLERWQRENIDKLANIARQYSISVDELKRWQLDELDRLYMYFNDQNNSMIPTGSLSYDTEQARLEELIRQHNATIDQLQSSIKLDQQKLHELSNIYRGNVQDMEKWLKEELARLGGIITEQRNEVTRITEWQRSERERLENIVKLHRGSVGDIDGQMTKDRVYLQNLANKYQVSIEELEKWQRQELQRLQTESQLQIEMGIKEWQKREHENLKKLITKNDLTIEEFQSQIVNDRQRLENLARTYQVQVTEVESWLRHEMQQLKNEGVLKEIQKELVEWQEKERQRLMSLVQQSEITVQELEMKIKTDQSHLNEVAANYNVQVTEIEEWLKQELMRLQSQGLIKVEDLKEWQKAERNEILQLVQANHLTIEEFEHKLLSDRRRLQELARHYNVQLTEIEMWIRKEGERLQSLGLLQIQEQLNNWQKIERDRLMALVQQNNYSLHELEEKIKKDQTHLYSMANQHQVRVEEIEEWIKKEIERLQAEGLVEISKLKDWQTEWRGNLTNMVKERDFTVEEFHKWLLEDRKRLQALAMTNNVQIDELETWIKNEEQRFVTMGLLKPNEKLTNWQEVERRYLERITQEQYHSTEQLEQRLRQDRELLEKLARDYQVQVSEIETWMKKELARLRDEGQLQINNLTAWQIAEKERLDALLKQNKQWTAEEFEAVLRQDREQLQKTAFQYHVSVEEIEKWIQNEVNRLQQQGKLNIEQLTQWQKEQHQRIMILLQQQSSITVEEFETKIQKDRMFLMNLAKQYNVNVNEVEAYVKKVIIDLKERGQFELEQLKAWQIAERDYIKNMIIQYKNSLSTEEYEMKLRTDREHLKQLADYYRVNIKEVEEWMVRELLRLRKESGETIAKLTAWQQTEVERLKQLIRENNRLNYLQFEVDLKKQREHLQQVSQQYSVSVEEIEAWLREQLLNLKTTGEIQVENMTKWQEKEQKNLIAFCLQQQRDVSLEEFERQLRKDRSRVEKLATDYNMSVEEVEKWMKDELKRLKDSGLVQVEQLSYWQKIERERLQDWLKQQNKAATTEELEEFIKRDKARLERIARDYKVTVAEIESWVEQESARLALLGQVTGPGHLAEVIQPWPVSQTSEEMWKEQTKAHLEAVAQVKPMTWQDFETYLRNERMRWEQFARQYQITVEQIESWLRHVAQNLKNQGIIRNTMVNEEWHIVENTYLQQLVNDKLRQQQQWSIEELERQLVNDRDHMQRLANQYRVTLEELTNWYRAELQKLLDQRKIVSENLTEWQKDQKERIYVLVKQQPYRTSEQWLQEILRDRNTLNRICDQYHVTIEEVEYWIRNEINRLVSLGLITSTGSGSGTSTMYKGWKEEERRRLRTIARDITITEEEFLEYIASDHAFQQQLTRMYGCTLEELVPFQSVEISAMKREGLLDRTALLRVEDWERSERDRLYSFIKDKSYTLENLRHWQRQESFINSLAAKYGMTAQALREWQLKEFARIMHLAQHYQMTLNQLQDFREKELRYLNYIMHKKISSAEEQTQWANNERRRMNVLQRKVNLMGVELIQWRRRLYLLCQARLALQGGGSGGHINNGTTNSTAVIKPIISKDRGDQPPNVFEEHMDPDEPQVATQDTMYPLPPAKLVAGPGSYGQYQQQSQYNHHDNGRHLGHQKQMQTDDMSGGHGHGRGNGHRYNDATAPDLMDTQVPAETEKPGFFTRLFG